MFISAFIFIMEVIINSALIIISLITAYKLGYNVILLDDADSAFQDEISLNILKAAQEYRNEAAELHNRVEESFERCDTDGFLSQWANGISANVASLNAEIAETGSAWAAVVRIDRGW